VEGVAGAGKRFGLAGAGLGVRAGGADAAGADATGACKGATGGATGAGTVPCCRVDPKSEDKSEERLGRAELGITGGEPMLLPR
jgi:hypothetical protein